MEGKFKFLGRYRKDTAAKAGAVFIFALGVLAIFIDSSLWPWVAGYLVLVLVIAYLKRNSP
jgi:hypothetical protein